MKNKKLTKKQIKAFARIHSAIHLSYADQFIFHEMDDDISQEDAEKVLKEINYIADKLSKNDPTNLGHSKEILDYIKQNY